MKAQLPIGIIGAGPGGIASGILLVRAGFRDFTFEPARITRPAADLSRRGGS